jgi:hypothetical protein
MFLAQGEGPRQLRCLASSEERRPGSDFRVGPEQKLPLLDSLRAYQFSIANNSSLVLSQTDTSDLSPEQEHFILRCLDDGIESTRVMCELMIQNCVTHESRYVTGKPRIYPWVCIFLDDLCSRSLLQCVRKSVGDRLYQRPSFISSPD